MQTQMQARETRSVSAQHPLFANVDAATLAVILAHSQTAVVRPGAELTREGDKATSVLLLLSGSLRQVAQGEGEALTTVILRAPAAVGCAEVMLGRNHLATAVALEKTTVLTIPAAVLRQAAQASPVLSANLLRDTAALLCVAIERQAVLAYCPVQARVAYALLSLVDAYGLPVQGGVRIRVAFSRDELASMLGVTRRTIARGLHYWTARGVLGRSGRNLVVRDLGQLKAAGSISLVHTCGDAGNPWLRAQLRSVAACAS